MKRTKLKRKSKSETALLKEEIQATLREIVIKRDGGCILRHIRHCGGEIGQAVLQADHLITRGNSATFADHRLVVCLCKPCHGGFKQWNKEQYDALIKTILPEETVKLWSKCLTDSWRPCSRRASDWKKELAALKQELKHYDS